MHSHQEYLKKVEHYLSDLLVTERLELLNKIQAEIKEKPDQELQDALIFTNIKRGEMGFTPYKEKKEFSIFKLFLKLTAAMTILFMLGLAVLIYNFTPLLKVDEENNRVTILGGFIDIDGKSGKFKFGDEVHFAAESYSNDLQANINLDSDKDEIIVHFSSGTFEVQNSEEGSFKFDCKLEKPATQDVIDQQVDFIKVNLAQVGGSNCKLYIPEDKKLSLEGEDSAINVISPEFNLYIDITNGKVSIKPEEEIDYIYNLEVKNGYVGEFESSEAENAYEINIRIKNGSIIRK